MIESRWLEIKNKIKDSFGLEEEGNEHLDEEGGIDIEYVVFSSPLGLIRLEYVLKPVILDRKTIYSRRIGSETKVDYIYSNTEKSATMTVYKWDQVEDDWIEISPDSLNL